MILLCLSETVISSRQQVSMYLLPQTGSSSDYVTTMSRGLILHCLLITNINEAFLFQDSPESCMAVQVQLYFYSEILHSGFTKSLCKSLPLQWHRLCSYWFTAHHILQLCIPCSGQSSFCPRGLKPRDLVAVNSEKILKCQNCWLKSRLLLALQRLDIPATEHVMKDFV